MREVLGGGSGGRYYADGEDTIHVVPDSRNLPTEFTEARFPFRVERLGAGRRLRRRRAVPRRPRLREAHPDARATRTSCRSPTARSWPAGASRAARPGSRSRSPSTRAARTSARSTPWPTPSRSRPARSIRIRTTGGGGWGDPLDRDPSTRSCATCVWRKVSRRGRAATTTAWSLTGRRRRPGRRRRGHRRAARRAAAAPRRPSEPFFDRGPGYARLAGGAAAAEVDWL